MILVTATCIMIMILEAKKGDVLKPIVFVAAFVAVGCVGVFLPLIGLTWYHCSLVSLIN